MTTATVVNCYGNYLYWASKEEMKELSEVTIEDMLKVYEDECETLHDLEIEKEVDHMLILAENNSKYDYEDNY